MKPAQLCIALALGLAAWIAPAVAHAERIRQIDVVDNTKTTDDTVIAIAGIEIGDDWNIEMVPQVEADLVNSGLFKDVDVFTQPVDGGVRVTIRAVDKHSWIIAPTFYNQPTNRGAGLGFGENNLFGEDKKLLLYGQVATGDSFFIGAYVDPAIAGSRFHWQLDTFLRHERVFEYAAPTKFIDDPKQVRRSILTYLNNGASIGINLWRGAKLDLRARGAYVYFTKTKLVPGACLEDVFGDPTNSGACTPPGMTAIPKPGGEGWDISSELKLTFDNTANWYGIFTGNKYMVALERSLPDMGSDFDYWLASAQYVRARKYFSRHNLIMKANAGFGEGVPFQQEWTSGGPDQRGLKNRQLRGNLRLTGTLEYSVPVLTIKGVALRGLGFFDTSYTTFFHADPTRAQRNHLPGYAVHGLAPWKNTVGAGVRLYIRQIVLPLLGLDFGYGLERGQLEIYFAIGLTAF